MQDSQVFVGYHTDTIDKAFTVAEQLKTAKQKYDALKALLDQLQTDVAINTTDIASNAEKIAGILQDIEQLKQDVEELVNAGLADMKADIVQLQTDIQALEDTISNLVSAIDDKLELKEDVANKTNEITNSTQLYPNVNAVLQIYNELKAAIQEVADDIPYIVQGVGQSTSDVMSQKAVTDKFVFLQNLIEAGLGIDFPEVDLTNYSTTAQVQAMIFNITGMLENLQTTDKIHLVSAINELLAKINNNITSIGLLQGQLSGIEGSVATVATNLATETTNRQNAVSGLQGQISGKADAVHTHSIANVTNLQSSLDGKANATHNHNISDVSNLQSSLDGKASTTHNHTVANITGLQGALDAKANSADVVNLTTAQTVGGVKTFSSTPVLPATNPTSDNQASRKGYVDAQVATRATVADLNTKANSSDLTAHTGNNTVHITATERTYWNNKADSGGAIISANSQPEAISALANQPVGTMATYPIESIGGSNSVIWEDILEKPTVFPPAGTISINSVVHNLRDNPVFFVGPNLAVLTAITNATNANVILVRTGILVNCFVRGTKATGANALSFTIPAGYRPDTAVAAAGMRCGTGDMTITVSIAGVWATNSVNISGNFTTAMAWITNEPPL